MRAARIVRCIVAARFIVRLSKKTPHEKKKYLSRAATISTNQKQKICIIVLLPLFILVVSLKK